MAVNRKALCNICLIFNNDSGAENGGCHSGNNCFNITRGHKRNNQKGDEKHKRRAEILNKNKRANTGNGKCDVGKNIFAGLDFFKSCRAHENKRYFNEFRWLKGYSCNFYPVSCAVSIFRNGKVYDKKQNRPNRNGQPQLHTKIHIAHQKHHYYIHDYTRNNHKALLYCRIGVHGADCCNAHGAQKKRNYFKLKISPVHGVVEKYKINPFNGN